jgi:hypothetical protein
MTVTPSSHFAVKQVAANSTPSATVPDRPPLLLRLAKGADIPIASGRTTELDEDQK